MAYSIDYPGAVYAYKARISFYDKDGSLQECREATMPEVMLWDILKTMQDIRDKLKDN